MTEQPSTSRQDRGLENCLSNIESARFLKRVLQKTEQEKKAARLRCTLERATDFTGLHSKIFIDQDISNIESTELKEIDRSVIHDRLMYFYVNQQAVPSTIVLFESLFNKIPRYVDIRTFRKYLASMGYIWVQAGKYFVVIERPQVTFERYYYLRDIVRYREEKREIFYVDETVLTKDFLYYNCAKYNSLKKAAAQAGQEINENYLLKNIYAVSKSGVKAITAVNKYTNEGFTRAAYEDFMINNLLPVLPLNSVVVIKNEKHHRCLVEKPSLYAMKIDMMKWLDSNNLPYDENMSKCELLTIIDNYTTENDRIDKIETILQSNGHTLLRLPFTCEKTSLAYYVFELIKLNAPKLRPGSLLKICESITIGQLQKYDAKVAEMEKETLQIDMRVDEVLDDLISRMGGVHMKGDVDSEVPLSDSD